MLPIERIVFSDTLPDSFFRITPRIYEELPFTKRENENRIKQLFLEETERNDIVIYTDHQNIRLVGIFPKRSDDSYFGFWETVDDQSLNTEAFTLLQNDALARRKKIIKGPLNFNTYQPYRLRLNNPSWIKFDNEPVNPLYYSTLLETLNFEITASFESRHIKKSNIGNVYVTKDQLLKEVRHIPFEFIPLTPDNWKAYEHQLYELAHIIFSSNPAYIPVSFEQFSTLYNADFAAKLCPHSSVLFRDIVSGRLASMSFCQPNYERLNFPQDYHPTFENDFNKLETKTLLAKTVGVHPDFRQQGLMNYMGAYAMLSFQNFYDEVIFCLTREGNVSNNFAKDLEYERADYALFSKVLIQ